MQSIRVPQEVILPSCESRLVAFPTQEVDAELDLEQALDRFCNAQPSDLQTKSQEEEEVLERHRKNLKFKDGRYITALPWKEEVAKLPSNFAVAKARLRSLLKQLKSNPEVLSKYNDNLQELQIGNHRESQRHRLSRWPDTLFATSCCV